MDSPACSAKDHYDHFLAEHYLWMAGGFEGNAARNREFFSTHRIRPEAGGVAVDLGAGCGFQAVPLAEAGFRVTAVDFCRPLLDELGRRAPAAGIAVVEGDILDFPLWSGRSPEVITCMGDTLTHLPDTNAVSALIRQCHAELTAGGKLILSYRDYTMESDGGTAVIPVRRDSERIFLCRLENLPEGVAVTDILYDRRSGAWVRTASEYRKLRLAPAAVWELLQDAGFRIDIRKPEHEMVVVVAVKK